MEENVSLKLPQAIKVTLDDEELLFRECDLKSEDASDISNVFSLTVDTEFGEITCIYDKEHYAEDEIEDLLFEKVEELTIFRKENPELYTATNLEVAAYLDENPDVPFLYTRGLTVYEDEDCENPVYAYDLEEEGLIPVEECSEEHEENSELIWACQMLDLFGTVFL